MFFILRCLFWLSIVYVNLPGETGGVSAAKFLDMASAHVQSFARGKGEALVARVADDGAEWCKAHGEACADAVLAAMLAKSPDAAAAPASADTLTPADKAARWRVPRRG